MVMTDVQHSDACRKVNVLASIDVPHLCTLRSGNKDRVDTCDTAWDVLFPQVKQVRGRGRIIEHYVLLFLDVLCNRKWCPSYIRSLLCSQTSYKGSPNN